MRAQADNDLSPAEKATTQAKIEARDSATESARVATVKGLDDRLGAATRGLATQPAAYRPGTLAALANAYDDAGESNKADSARRMALQEGFLLPFARSGAATQQRLIDSLPEDEDRAAAEAIQRRQAEAFAQDPFTAGTALYPDVGPPAPINDLSDRIAQARTIAAYRGIPVAPFTTNELATLRRKLVDGTPQERDALTAQLDALPEDMKAALTPVSAMSDATDRPPHEGDQIAQLPPVTIFGRPPPIVTPRPPLTPLEELPEGSAGGPNAGKAFSRGTRDEYPEGTPCTYCKKPTTKEAPGPDQLQLDHVKPRKDGGNNSEPNRVPACRTCNLEKGGRDPKRWYDWREVY